MNFKLRQSTKDLAAIILLLTVVLLTRIPFIENGYGAEEDSWGLVLNARSMDLSGTYTYSRLPGHPIQEGVLWLMPYAGAFVFNLWSVFFSLVCVLFFILILKHYKLPFMLPALALAMLPVFYIQSVSSIDYLWALAFILAAWYALLRNKFLISGLLLGLAFGCRITSALYVLPMLIIIWSGSGEKRLSRSLILMSAAGFTALLTYIPALTEYGTGIFSTYRLPYPPLAKVLYKGSIGVAGLTGMVALMWALIFIIKNRKQKVTAETSLLPRHHGLAMIVAILLTLALYIRLPEKSAFLIPALPFLLLLISVRIRQKIPAAVFHVLLILSPFLAGMNLSDPYRGSVHSANALKFTVAGQEIFVDPLSGPVFDDYSKRQNKAAYTLALTASARHIGRPTVWLSGWWHNETLVRMQDADIRQPLIMMEFATEEQLKYLQLINVPVFYLQEIDQVNDRKQGAAITSEYASPWPAGISSGSR